MLNFLSVSHFLNWATACWYCLCPMNLRQKSPAPSPRQSMTAKSILLHRR